MNSPVSFFGTRNGTTAGYVVTTADAQAYDRRGELDRTALGHNTFTPDALALILRSGEGLLRRIKNLCVASLIEAVRDQIRTVDLKQVNRVLIQPHWRNDCDQPL